MEIRTKVGNLVRMGARAPWQWSAALSAIALIGAFVGVPMLAARDPAWEEVETGVTLLMLILAALFGFVALIRSIFGEHEVARVAPAVERRSEPDPARSLAHDSTFWQQHRDRRGEPVVDVQFHDIGTPTRWSLELLQSLDAKRFAEVVAGVFLEHGFRIEPATHGSGDAIDGRIFFRDVVAPVGVVRCRVGREPVGVAPVGELLDLMLVEGVERGHFVAAGGFAKEAMAFVAVHPIRLVPGADLLATIADLDASVSARLLAATTQARTS